MSYINDTPIHTLPIEVLGVYCNVGYMADNYGITIHNVVTVNGNEQLDVWSNEQLVNEIVDKIYSAHEEANQVDQ